MKRLHSRFGGVTLASVSALAISAGAPAHAEAFNWTGFYIGGNAGTLWGHSNMTSGVPCTATFMPPGYFCATIFPILAMNAAAVGAAGTGSISASGFTGGVQAGYNWQNGNIVAGLEADFGAFHFHGSQSVSALYPILFPLNKFTVGTSAEANWLFTARGRIGWTVKPNILAYATGGLAVTRIQVANSFTDNNDVPGASGGGSNSAIKTGWVLGGGLEWAFDKNWTAKVEYLYVDFGSVAVNNSVITNPNYSGYRQAMHLGGSDRPVARVGINYKF